MSTAKEPFRSQSELLSRLVLAVTAGAGLAGPGCSSSSAFPSDYAAGGSPTSGGSTSTGGSTSNGAGTSATGGGVSVGGAAGSPSGDGDGEGMPPLECVDRRAETAFCSSREAMEHQARYGFYQEPLDPPRSDEQIAAAFDENGCMRPDWVADGCCNAAIAPGKPQDDGTCCYVSCAESCCGRPLIVAGQAHEAKPVARTDWSGLTRLGQDAAQLLGCVDGDARNKIAAAYVRDGLLEHASVASFCRFALQLLGLGAPPALVRAANQAALDEVKHAQLCFGLASALCGAPVGPSPLPEATAQLSAAPRDLLEAAIIEGCVGETISAALVREQAHVAVDPLIRKALDEIADDELRHAELSWKTVAWLMRSLLQDTTAHEIESLVTRAFNRARNQAFSLPQLEAVASDVANYFGRLSTEQAEGVRATCLHNVVEPGFRHLLAETAQARQSHARAGFPVV